MKAPRIPRRADPHAEAVALTGRRRRLWHPLLAAALVSVSFSAMAGDDAPAAAVAPSSGPATPEEGELPDPYAGMKAWHGDIHVHSGLALYRVLDPGKPHSIGTPDEIIDAAASRGLDFVVITEHSNNVNDPKGIAWRMKTGNTFELPDGSRTAEEWVYLQSAVRRLNRPGRFVVFLGLEYTKGDTESARPGHQLGIFPGDSLPRYCSNFPHNAGDCLDHRDFFDFVIAQGGTAVMAHPCDAITWGPSDWSEYDPIANGMELMSGDCEFGPHGYNDALGRMGLRIGARGSSDTHHYEVGARNKTACLAPELTRGAILDAMKANRCYFVLHHPIDLRFSINGVPMGGEVVGDGTGLAVRAVAHTDREADFGFLELIHDGEVVEKHECRDVEYDDCEMESYVLSGGSGYWYVALTSYSQRRLAISSPVWVGTAP